MHTNPERQSKPGKKQGRTSLIIVLVCLVLISGVKLYTDYVDRSKKAEEIIFLSIENNRLNDRIDSVTFQLNLRIQEIERLGGDIETLETLRDQLLTERNELKQRSEPEILALNEKIKSLTGVLLQKDREILELRASNQELYSENKDLKTTQTKIEKEVKQLTVQKQQLQAKVDEAAKLRVENIQVAAINSRGKERLETVKDFKRRQMEKLKVSFKLADNKIAEKGPRNIFIQVLAPTGQPIFDVAKGSGTFLINGREQFYTAKQDIIFDNSGQNLVFFYEKGSDYSNGDHLIKIFIDTYPAGSKTFTIK
jgi:hypothetical protein